MAPLDINDAVEHMITLIVFRVPIYLTDSTSLRYTFYKKLTHV